MGTPQLLQNTVEDVVRLATNVESTQKIDVSEILPRLPAFE